MTDPRDEMIDSLTYALGLCMGHMASKGESVPWSVQRIVLKRIYHQTDEQIAETEKRLMAEYGFKDAETGWL
jgi:hypothetical protein